MEVQQTELEQTNAHPEAQTQQLGIPARTTAARPKRHDGTSARELELASQYKSEFRPT